MLMISAFLSYKTSMTALNTLPSGFRARDDNLFHRMLIPLYAKRERPQARPLTFAVLKIFVQTPL